MPTDRLLARRELCSRMAILLARRSRVSGRLRPTPTRCHRARVGGILSHSYVRGTATAVVCFLSLAGCSTQAPRVENPQATPAASPTSTVTRAEATPSPTPFESERHAYTALIPAGWQVTEYEGEWTKLDQFSPGAEVPGEDVIARPDLSAFLVMDSMPIPDGMSPKDWLEAFNDLVEAGIPPDCSTSVDRGVFASEPATVVEQQCDGLMITGRSLTHERRGYYFTIVFPEGDGAAEAALDAIVTSVRFT